MTSSTKTPSASLCDAARADALQSVSKWHWTALGVVLSIVPTLNIVLLGISTVVVSVLTPTIALSTPSRLEVYFQHPARYTAEYRRTVKRVRCMRMFYGWLAGAIVSNLF